MNAKTVVVLVLVPWMTVAAGSCRSGPAPIQAETPEATAESSPTSGPIQTELTEIAEDFGPTPGALTFAPDILPTARVGEMYEAGLRITENVTPVGEFSISEGTLPPGLELEFVEGEDAALIRGIPEEPGSSSFTVSVWCFGTQVSGQTGEKEYTLVVES
jgi:hypothetical protein